MKPTIDEYRRRRDFEATPEPRGGAAAITGAGVARFVVHWHETELPHYDFHLELGGVLKSWVIPDGPPEAGVIERLALQMEDHPVEYAEFEGVIPPGAYGAGAMRIWDSGTYEIVTDRDGETLPAHHALEQGELAFRLRGAKLDGEYTLRRTEDGNESRWFLIRTDR